MNHKQIIADRLSGFTKHGNKKQCWVVKFDGEILKTPSGKSAWNQINHAKTALRNALPNYHAGDLMDTKEILNQLQAEGRLEFINIANETTI